MKKTLIEELERIHSITYGKNGVIEDNSPKKIDDPKKADLVSDSVESFFSTLENIKTELSQQSYGSMKYQKEVETVQIALTLLGYGLPRFGIDGLYGSETANAVLKFKNDNNIDAGSELKEYRNLSFSSLLNELVTVQLDDVAYSNVKIDNDSTKYDYVNKALLDDLQKAAAAADLTLTITTASSGHPDQGTNKSRHSKQIAVDIAILDGMGSSGASNPKNGNPKFRELGNRLKDALVQLGYTWNTERGNDKAVLWQTNTGGNHYNHLHVSNKSGASDAELSKISKNSSGSAVTLEMIKLMIEKLKQRGVTSEDLKKLIDSIDKKGIEISLSGDWLEITKGLLRKHEGYQEKAKWDENAYRGGYGSDKKLINGKLVDATRDTLWTRQEAEETMDYEIKNFYAPTVAKQLGSENWNKLNDKQKAALISLGYNAGPYFVTAREYGRKIKKAIQDGDMELAATYIQNGPTTGSGSGRVYAGLQKRRREESDIFMA
jgi:GH24 family phage-related lysozyme (muramidase)